MTNPVADPSPLLKATGLTVVSSTGHVRRPLVSGIGFSLAHGEAMGIVGESGCGKSMTVRSLVGLLPHRVHAEGEVTFDGLPLIGRPEKAFRALRGERISLLLQDPFTMLNPLQRVGATLRESLAPRLRADRGASAREVTRRLAEVGLDADVAGRYPFQLSGGMRQRVAMAAALARDPELLLADEPTTALDMSSQAEVLALLGELRRSRGMALILVTHDLDVAFSTCDTVQVMYAGNVLESGPVAAVAARPQHPYTLGLLTSRIPRDHYREELTSIPGGVPAAEAVTDGCAFAARCAWSTDDCGAGRPELSLVDRDHRSACVRITGIRDEMDADLADRGPGGGARPATGGRPDDLVVVRGLGRTFRSRPLTGAPRSTVALDGVSFHIGEGESVGLVGESGSGKSTIARILLGLDTADTGEIRYGGHRDPADRAALSSRWRRQRRRPGGAGGRAPGIQIVFQDPYASLNPSLTIGSTLREAAGYRPPGLSVGEPAPTETELLAMVGLPAAYASRRPSALSGGERQRVAIARAIATAPELLVCDEPVAALDVSVQAQVLELFRDLRRKRKIAMLFITHDLAVARQMTERVIVLRRGRVVESGETAAVLDHPQHWYTRRLVGSAPADATREAAVGDE
ncbi:dipeptide ABC transporter ATP-binding protein [Streptomyces sp. NPDC004838]